MALWLLGYGVGGCWSGYTDATVIQAVDEDEAKHIGFDITVAETKEERGFNRGCSYHVEMIGDDVRDCLMYKCRLKPGARILAELAYNDMTLAVAS